MKRYIDLNKEKQTTIIADIFKQFVILVVGDKKTYPVLEMDFKNKKDNGYIELIRQTADETGDYESAYIQVGRKFYNQIMTLSKTVAEDSNYSNDGNIITNILPNELH
jgi:hypothetical protein